MADVKYSANIQRVRELLGHVGRQHEVLLSKSLFGLLGCTLRSIKGCPDSTLLANSNMAVLDDICCGKFVVLSRILQNVLCNIYTAIFQSAPGYAVRNTVSNLLVICTNKATSATGRECSTSIIGHIVHKRNFDCGSLLTEVVTFLTKQIKSQDSCRLATMKALTLIILGSKCKIQDLHGEIIKTSSKFCSDKSPDLRLAVAVLFTAIAETSGSTEAVAGKSANTAQEVTNVCMKCLDDVDVTVQSTYAAALARVLIVQMKDHYKNLDELKIGQNRGGGEEVLKKKDVLGSGGKFSSKISTAFTAAVSSSSRKLIDDYTLTSILAFYSKHIGNKAFRAPFVASLTYFFADISPDLSDVDLTSIVVSSLHLLQDPAMTTMSHEETVFFRARVSLMIRTGITTSLTEGRKLFFIGALLSCLAGEENKDLILRNEYQVLVALNELAHCIRLLQDAAVGVCDEVKDVALSYLGHSSFGIRTAASSTLSATTSAVPALVAPLIQQALLDARAEVKSLLHDGMELQQGCGTIGGVSPRVARLSSMFRFHGNALLISTLLRSEGQTVSSFLPRVLVLEALSLGLDLLQEDVLHSLPSNRSVVCSVIRAGSLIVSSCMHAGYAVVQGKILEMLAACDVILRGTLAVAPTPVHVPAADEGMRQISTGSGDSGDGGGAGDSLASEEFGQDGKHKDAKDGVPSALQTSDDNLLYELMTVEAALVLFSSLLWFCPEALSQQDHCLGIVVDGLEIAFRAVKLKYQPKFRNHFRFRTLHAILLECFTWLPRGAFPNCCQQVFIEALRVFRDGISSGFACTTIQEHIFPHQALLDPSHYITQYPKLHLGSLYGGCGGSPSCDVLFMLRMEHLTVSLQKKETEASLVSFGGRDSTLPRSSLYAPTSPLVNVSFETMQDASTPDQKRGLPPVIEIDSRTISAAIGLLSTTFVNQTPEYQTKTCILCAQAIEQFSLKPTTKDSYSSISNSLFGSDDERKKREKRAYSAFKNVVCAFNAIIAGFPTHHGAALDIDLNWGQLVVDTLFELTTCEFCDIRTAASNGLASFASKLPGSGLIEILTERTSTSLSLALDMREKKKELDCCVDLSGYLILLAELFAVSPARPDTRLHIMATIFDCIRKVDVSISFRAHAFNAMSVIFKDVAILVGGSSEESTNKSGSSTDSDKAAFRAFLDKIWHSLDVHAVSIQSSGEGPEMLLTALLRLVSAATPLTLSNIPSNAFVDHLLLTFDAMRCAAFLPTPPLQEQALVMIQHFPAKRHLGTILHVLIDCIIKHTYSTSTSAVSLLATNLSVPVSSYSHATLVQVLLSVEKLVKSYPEECVAAGLDVVLFHLLHWTASHPALSYDLLPSLENRRFDLEVDTLSLVRCLIHTLAREDCKAAPHHRTGRWLLMLRNLSSGVVMTESRDMNDGGTGTAGVADFTPVVSYRQFVAQCKEDAARRLLTICGNIHRIGAECSALTSSNPAASGISTEIASDLVPDVGLLLPVSTVKIVAVSLAATLLSSCGKERLDTPHRDILLARMSTDDALAALDTSSSSSYSSVSLHLPLLLHDMVSFGVSTATFSINDKVLPCLYLEAVRTLEALIRLFGSAADPDAAKDAENVSAGGALSQYSSQLLSAIRPGLQSPSPDLRFACCRVLFSMLERGLCTDNVAVRRLVGNIVGTTQSTRVVSSIEERPRLRAIMRGDCNETQSTVDFYVAHIFLAKIYLLASSNSFIDAVHASICTALLVQLEPVLPSLQPVWKGMCIDAVRFLQIKRNVGSEESPLGAEAVSLLTAWPKQTPQTDGMRGGTTYPSSVSATPVRQYLLHSLPATLAALCTSTTVVGENDWPPGDAVDLYHIACAILDHHCDSSNEEEIAFALRALSALGAVQFRCDGGESHNPSISIEQWVTVVRYASARILAPLAQGKSGDKDALLLTMSTWLRDLVGGLRAGDMEPLYEETFRASLLSLLLVFPSFFPDDGIDSQNRTQAAALLSGRRPRVASSVVGAALDRQSEHVVHILIEALIGLCFYTSISEDKNILLEVLCRLLPVMATLGKGSATSTGRIIHALSKVDTTAIETPSPISIPQMLICDVVAWRRKGDEEFWLAFSNALRVIFRVGGGGSGHVVETFAPLLDELLDQDGPTLSLLSRSFLQCTLRCISDEAGVSDSTKDLELLGSDLLSAMLPAVLCLVHGEMFPNQEMHVFDDSSILLLLRIIFEAFKMSPAKEPFLTTLLLPLCDHLLSVVEHSSAPTPTSYQFVGRALTQVALAHPQTFKEHIAILQHPQRNRLQTCLRSTAERLSAAAPAHDVGRIDVSKFRK